MSIESALIAEARPFILNARAQAIIGTEIAKGCSGLISAKPVALEPPYAPLSALVDGSGGHGSLVPIEETWFGCEEPIRLRVWISPKQKFEWNRSELFLKQLVNCGRVAFEIAGNDRSIEVTLLCRQESWKVIETAFIGAFEHCRLFAPEACIMDAIPEAMGTIRLADYFPEPPYYRLLTSFDELKTSPYETFLCALQRVMAPGLGFFQCVFQATSREHDWHFNVERLIDLEYGLKLNSNLWVANQFTQQSPSGDLRRLAYEAERKAHNDKPFFASAVRIGCVGGEEDGSQSLAFLTAFASLFQHGGKSLRQIAPGDYDRVISKGQQREMIYRGLTHRPGFLLNSKELTGLAHMFPAGVLEERRIGVATLETLPVEDTSADEGTVIGMGIGRNTGEEVAVRIPPEVRDLATHIVASSGWGKSCLMIRMALQDIREGKGVVFIDAHGDSLSALMRRLPLEARDQCIYFNPGDAEWVPLWNPLKVPKGGSIYNLADDLLSVLERVSRDWGDRLAHVLRNGLIGLGYLGESTVFDLFNLTRQKSEESKALRERIRQCAIDETVKSFWEHDFEKDYKSTELAAPKHKLSVLLNGGSLELMFSQPEGRIDFREIMDTGKVLLVDLSSVGADSREVLGSFILTMFMMAAFSRSNVSYEGRKPFSIFADEAHLFVSADAIENMIAQMRKFRVGLCIAHQFLRQFKTEQIDAVSTVGTTIIGRLDKRDSQYFAKDFQDRVTRRDIIRLKQFQMIARVGSEIMRIRTLPLSSEPQGAGQIERRIIERSRQRYCRRSVDLRAELSLRLGKAKTAFREREERHFAAEELEYDEF